QATVLVWLPHTTTTDDLSITIDRNYLVVGVTGQTPTIKGRLYSSVITATSLWQLEPRHPGLRERTSSSASTTSTHSSYAYISDPDISSSFAASLESDAEDIISLSPALSSPTLSSADEPGQRILPSNYSSLDSFHGPGSGRLLTLHLEKEQSIIWPSLIVGPAPEALTPQTTHSVVFNHSHELEHQYNMDPTSLALIGLDLFDIRRDRDEAFEYFLHYNFRRAWHQAHIPSATMRLVSHYLPLSGSYNLTTLPQEPAPRGTTPYYLQCIGGAPGLAQLYLEAGLLHLEGAASTLLSSSYSTLSSLRVPPHQASENGTEAWNRDRQAASNYFDRARLLQPDLDIPVLSQRAGVELEMPLLDLGGLTPESVASRESLHTDTEPPLVKRRRKGKEEESVSVVKKSDEVDGDGTWYYYIPALVVVGVVGALSFSSWSRRHHGS
ncbi:hypothetical protein AGABI2DRAFT_65847, partial [Agaricus bisporus var. bisporus H97]|uniref:hypothetical protein n=1 Tax=Agaricus bisporus var. bisporus (strain H97 / ATCC MYA-4626 / FGSC 10389) TaxID=936046 RepID=UPI00029F7C08